MYIVPLHPHFWGQNQHHYHPINRQIWDSNTFLTFRCWCLALLLATILTTFNPPSTRPRTPPSSWHQNYADQSRFHEVSSSSVLLLGVLRAQVKAKQRFTMEGESSFFCKMDHIDEEDGNDWLNNPWWHEVQFCWKWLRECCRHDSCPKFYTTRFSG